MLFIRYLFLVLILSCSTSIGFLLSKRFADRLNELNTISNLTNTLQNKIRFTRMPLKEIFEELAEYQDNLEISDLFRKIAKKMEKMKTSDAWVDAIDEKKLCFNLSLKDLNLIKTLGNTLGKTDIDGQMSEIEQFNTLLKIQIKEAEHEKNKNEKMYRSLGTIVGLAIVILLF